MLCGIHRLPIRQIHRQLCLRGHCTKTFRSPMHEDDSICEQGTTPHHLAYRLLASTPSLRCSRVKILATVLGLSRPRILSPKFYAARKCVSSAVSWRCIHPHQKFLPCTWHMSSLHRHLEVGSSTGRRRRVCGWCNVHDSIPWM